MVKDSEFQPSLQRDHAGRTVTAQANTEQSGRRRRGVRQRPKTHLCRGFPRNARVQVARKTKIRVVEHIEELAFYPELQALAQSEPFGEVEITPEKIRSAKRIPARSSELAILLTVPAVAGSGAWIDR